MNRRLFLAVYTCFSGILNASADMPYVEISNGLVKAGIYLPDAENGYYQGTRFDWAGNISMLEYKGHHYFGQWFEKHNPKMHDAILGPVESFNEIGFSEAAAGGDFLRIGVGGLRKTDDSRFDNFKLYPISNPGKWKIKTSTNKVEFTHTVNDAAGYSYIYTKTVVLTEGHAQLVLAHTLKNTGKKAIHTDVYNHNFFTIDSEPTGPNVIVRFPFDVQGKWNKDNDLAVIDGKTITYPRVFNKKESVFMGDMQGFGRSEKDYDFRIENKRTGAGVRILADRPIKKINYWASSTTSCPEPYIDIAIQPGEQFSWKNTYQFYIKTD